MWPSAINHVGSRSYFKSMILVGILCLCYALTLCDRYAHSWVYLVEVIGGMCWLLLGVNGFTGPSLKRESSYSVRHYRFLGKVVTVMAIIGIAVLLASVFERSVIPGRPLWWRIAMLVVCAGWTRIGVSLWRLPLEVTRSI